MIANLLVSWRRYASKAGNFINWDLKVRWRELVCEMFWLESNKWVKLINLTNYKNLLHSVIFKDPTFLMNWFFYNLDCGCNIAGIKSCSGLGSCTCKAEYSGRTCSSCALGYYKSGGTCYSKSAVKLESSVLICCFGHLLKCLADRVRTNTGKQKW